MISVILFRNVFSKGLVRKKIGRDKNQRPLLKYECELSCLESFTYVLQTFVMF